MSARGVGAGRCDGAGVRLESGRPTRTDVVGRNQLHKLARRVTIMAYIHRILGFAAAAHQRFDHVATFAPVFVDRHRGSVRASPIRDLPLGKAPRTRCSPDAIAAAAMDESLLIQFFEEHIPFNKHLGMKVEEMSEARVRIRIPFAPHLIGDPLRPALHGGVTSTIADTAGGLAVFARVGLLTARVSTVDLRVDYYLPAGMKDVIAQAEVVRLGNRVGVSRISVWQPPDEGEAVALIAEGKGVYNIHKNAINPAEGR